METPDPAVFGPLAAIAPESVVLLASNIAKRCLDLPDANGTLVARICGSYNMVHVIEFQNTKLVIRVPVTGWGPGLTQTAADAMESQAATLRLIRSKTTIPVPEIYALDTSVDNEIGAPYLCMSYLPGKTVSKVWFGYEGALPRDEFRLRILTSLSQAMAQLSCFSFDRMGSIIGGGSDSTVIGPAYGWESMEDGSLQVQVTASGPYDSTSAFLHENTIRVPRRKEDVWHDAETKVLEVMLDCLPAPDSPPSFVLEHPDFASQNVLVDEEGTVTGLIDWDNAQTVPRFVGYASYPSWITRDWDPLMYGWPMMPESEDSPETLERYRAHYHTELGKALKWQGDWKYTGKGHIFEAIWIAALNSMCRLRICQKFVQVVVGDDTDALDIFYDMGTGYYEDEDWVALKVKLRRFICED
ncbi:kinase-like domain-containing protein [Xylaria palmicola]|nr:kinase-like domain-containing protein [Xylaria palmicola]